MSSMITDQSPIAFDDAIDDGADVVVIGGGIAGVATAYFLAQQGKSVVVCEKGRIAGEQSSRNWGWVRQQRRDAAELPIVMESARIWRSLASETGEADLGFTECGCVQFIEDESVMAKCEAWVEVSKQHQLASEVLTPKQISERFPGVSGNWLGAIYTPSDGRGEPFVAVPALARAAARAGVRIRENCAVRTIDTSGGNITGVYTETGRIACQLVVLAGGAWSTHFASNAGIALPQLAVRSTAARTNVAPDVVGPMFWAPELAMRRRADGGYTVTTGDLAEHYLSPNSIRFATKFRHLMLGSSNRIKLRVGAPKDYPGSWGMKRTWSADDETPFEKMRVLNPPPAESVVRRLQESLPRRVPALQGIGIAEAWAGMIDVTPDAVPYIGESHVQPGLFILTGLSGHGFGMGPGAARVMADLVCGRSSGHNINRFRTNRFSDGSKIVPGPY